MSADDYTPIITAAIRGELNTNHDQADLRRIFRNLPQARCDHYARELNLLLDDRFVGDGERDRAIADLEFDLLVEQAIRENNHSYVGRHRAAS